MVDPRRPDSDPSSEDPNVRNGVERRDVMRALAGFGLLAAGGTLGESLLVRSAWAQKAGQVRTTTVSSGFVTVYTIGSTVPNPLVTSGVETGEATDSGSFTRSGGPETSAGYTYTIVGPGPLAGGTQVITVAGTQSYSFTPPATNTQTCSWSGSSWTITNSRSPTYFTASVTDSRTCTYSTTTPGGNMADPDVEIRADIGQGNGEGAALAELDLLGVDLTDPRTRCQDARILSFACGVAHP